MMNRNPARFLLIFAVLISMTPLFASLPYPPQDQWDEVRSFYGNAQSIPEEYIDYWRPYTTARAEREAGLLVLPDPPLNPAPGVHLDPDLAGKGMVSVIDFGADPTGVADSTEAIQAAVEFGRNYAMVTFFPEGTYTVSGTIKAWSLTRVDPEYLGGRISREDFYVPVLVGSAAGASRPVIRLAPGTFPDYVPNDRRFVVEFRNFNPPDNRTFTDEHGHQRFRYEFYPEMLEPTERERFRENTPDHIGPEFRGIDIEIAENNAGASGLRFPTAETSGVGDVEIRFLGDGHVGFQGPPGGGSATLNMTIIGGRIGLDTTSQNMETGEFPNSGAGAQPTPVLTGLRLINQTELAVRSQVRGTLVGVGWHIETQLNGPVIMLRHAWYGDPFSSSFALIDSTIDYQTAMPFGNVVIGRYGDVENRNRSFSLDNVYVRNAQHIYRAHNLPQETFAANPIGWFHVKRLAYERQPADRAGYTLRERIWLNGALHDTWVFRGQPLAPSENPPTDLISRHLHPGTFPHFEIPGAVNVRDHGAVGDAVADDTAAFQAAIAASAANGSHVVFVPRGYFKISDTLDLNPETKLIGLNRQWSVITTSQADGVFGGASNRSDYPEGIPLIRSADSATADTVIAHLRLAVGFPIKMHNGWWTGGGPPDFTQSGAIPYEESMVEVYPLQWRSGGTSVVRECMFNPRGEFNFHFNLYDEETYAGAIFLNPLIRMEGNAGGRWYGFHFHGYYPFGAEGSLIRIENNTQPIHFYHLHAQHNTALNLIDLVESSYVSIYGIKTEHHKTLLRSAESSNLRIYGHGGIATPAPGGQHYLFKDTQDFLISAIGDEVQFGSDSSHGSGWSIMYFTNFENYRLFTDKQSGVEYYPPFNERPILYKRGHPHAGSPIGPLVTHQVTFTSGGNGSIMGPLVQYLADGASSALVTAVPNPGYSFAGWSGDHEGQENPLYLRSVSDNQTVTANFMVSNDSPDVSILQPQGDLIAYTGETITLVGTALDTEDGDLTASAQWTSSRDGLLGIGGNLPVTSLSTGLHQIAFAATDSVGQTSTAIVLVYVQPDPIVVPDLSGASPGNNTPWLPTRVLHSGLSYSGLIRGSGMGGASSNNGFEVQHAAPGEGADLDHVLANNQYIGFTLTPEEGMALYINGATFRFLVSRENNSAASSFTLFSSVDGFTAGTEIGTADHSAPATDSVMLTYTFSGARFDDVTEPLELRIYPHDASWSRKLLFHDFAFFNGWVGLEGQGSVTPPSAAALFKQDFSSSTVVADYIGTDDHLFDHIGHETRGELSVVGGRLRNTIAYTDDGDEGQFSASRATRRTDLPMEDNFALVHVSVRLAPDAWPSSDTIYFGMAVGENFRAGNFNPAAGGGNGPSFAALNLQARAAAHTFRTIGVGGNSANFTATPHSGVYHFDLVLAANGGETSQTFHSPSGEHTLQDGRVSVWINDTLHIDNTSTGVTAADIVNFSVGTGSGTAQGYATGSRWNGFYEIDEIIVQTVSNLNEPTLRPYDIWIAAQGLSDDDALPTADPGDTGFINLTRYAFGMTYTAPDPAESSLAGETNGAEIILRHVRNATAPDVIWSVEETESLLPVDWRTVIDPVLIVTPIDEHTEEVEWQVTPTNPTSSFWRVRGLLE